MADGQTVVFPELVLENGSGLSRNERISAQSLGRLLVNAYASPIMPEYISSLPLMGLDGTTKNRLKTSPLAGFAHIKTGTLQDVRGIAGYVLAASGRRYAVVSIVNGSSAHKSQTLHNQLLTWIYDQG
jgi:D-alanyl-D-alanine carboxypeptidase/D-alanyl-D-alanine-endopeptidase (penicillin-binding protein 4)